MRKEFAPNPWTYPQPVFVLGTYGKDGTPNAMVAAWGCISDMHEVTILVDRTHLTIENLKAHPAFTLSMADADHMAACDYLGIVSGKKDPGKVAKVGFHAVPAAHVDAPVFDELAMALECRMVSYDPETQRLIGEIVSISADERILDENGKIDPVRLRPISFDPIHNAYYDLGARVGQAFHDGLSFR